MRYSPTALALALAFATVSSAVSGQLPDKAIDPLSVELVTLGKVAEANNDSNGAIDHFETALAVDPRNIQAYTGLARVAEKQGLPGKAIRLYREALVIDPNDVATLAAQGEAMVAKGAVERARDNLARIEKLCGSGCPEKLTLASAIDKSVATAMASPVANGAPILSPPAPPSN